jgi:hypothetical protein
MKRLGFGRKKADFEAVWSQFEAEKADFEPISKPIFGSLAGWLCLFSEGCDVLDWLPAYIFGERGRKGRVAKGEDGVRWVAWRYGCGFAVLIVK